MILGYSNKIQSHAVQQKGVKAWCKENEVSMLQWTGNSPDMNPIENLWDVLKDEIHQVPITIKFQLIKRLSYIFGSIPLNKGFVLFFDCWHDKTCPSTFVCFRVLNEVLL